MTPADFNTARATLGFDLAQTAAWLGINPSTAWRYANGSSPIPGPVARALRLACGVRSADRVDIIVWDEFSTEEVEAQDGDYIRAADLAPLLAMEGGE